jgi:hypothetical protein
VPVTVGWNVIVRVQLPFDATELPQLFVSVKSEGLVPPRVMLLMVSAVGPTFVNVTLYGELVWPTVVVGNPWPFPDNFTYVPGPESGTVCGLPAALSLIETEAVRVSMAVGWKLILIVQVAPAATELPQVFV